MSPQLPPLPLLQFIILPVHAPYPNIESTPYAVLPINNRQLISDEVEAIVKCYFPPDEVLNAINIAHIESDFWTAAHNQDGEDSRGLFQINLQAHPHLQRYNLFDPQINAYFAHVIWQEAEGWTPWLNAAKKLGLI